MPSGTSRRPASLSKHSHARISDPAFFEAFPSILNAIFVNQEGLPPCLLDSLDLRIENYYQTQFKDAQSSSGKNMLKNLIKNV